MAEIIPVLGILAGIVGAADTVPYVRDILRGSTRPHRGTWLVWALISIVICFSQVAEGASWSLIMLVVEAALTSVTFILAIRWGVGGLRRVEVTMMAIAGVGVAGWMIADAPLVATVCILGADLLGAAMMVPKTYRDPDSETLSTYALASLSGALAAGAVGGLAPALLIYPVYFCLVNGGIAILIALRRKALRPRAADPRRAPVPRAA